MSSRSTELMYRRLSEVRMSEVERIRARAHLERAEAVADFLASAVEALRRVVTHAG